MTDKDIQEYYDTKEGQRVKKLIESNQQDAVVYSVTTDRNHRHIKCWSPVWKTVYVTQDRMDALVDEVQRGDIVTLSRLKDLKYSDFSYSIVENKTASQIKYDSIGKILKDFDDAQQQNILWISEYQRLNKLK